LNNLNAIPYTLSVMTLPGMPLVQPGDDLPSLILEAMARADLVPQDGDVLVVTSKIVSKAEGQIVDLKSVEPGAEAQRLAQETRKDPRIVELALRDAHEVVRSGPGILVTRHRLGFVSANAGIDQSNVDGTDDHVLLLPCDPDQSARGIRTRLHELTGAHVGVVISDSHGRPFRMGNIGVAIGVSGLPALLDLRGNQDLFGRVLKISMMGYADMIASTANLMTGEGSEGRPVVLLRGLQPYDGDGSARDLNRPAEQDLFR